MKKKFLIIALSAIALASCNETSNSTSNSTNSGSTSSSVNSGSTSSGVNSGSTSTSTSTQPEQKNISLNALKSIFETFTAEGSVKTVYNDFDAEIDNNVYVAFGANSVEVGFNKKTEELKKTKYYNNNGYIAIEYRNAQNESALVDVTNYNDEKVNWTFSNNIYASVKVTDFVSTSEENVFEVTNSATRMAVARTLLTDLYYPIDAKTGEDPKVESMLVKVTGDVISDVSFKTATYFMYDKRYDDGTMDPFFKVYDEVNLTLTNHKSTEISKDVVPYETYSEAEALKNAFQNFANTDIVASIKYYKGEELFLSSESYFLSDLYYNVSNNKGSGYVYLDDLNSLVKFSVVDDKATSERVFENESIASAELTYIPNSVAVEMFKYENGKYVTRSVDDAQMVAGYVLLDGMPQYVSNNISITLAADAMLFEYELTITNSSNVTTTYTCTMEVKKYVEGTLTLDLDALKNNVRVMQNLSDEMLGTFTSADNVLDIDTFTITLNGKELVVSDITDNVITGTYEGQTITLTFTSNFVSTANGTINNSTFNIAIADAEAVQVTFDSYVSNLVYIFNVLGVEALPAFEGAGYYYVDLSQYQTTGMILFAVEANETKGSFTMEDLTAYLAALNDNFFLDASDVPTNQIFNVDSIIPVKTFLGVSYAYLVFDAAQSNLALAGFDIMDGLILIQVMA